MERRSLNNIEQLQGLITTLDYQESVKKDYVAPSTQLLFVDGKLVTTINDKQISYEPSSHFHAQVAAKLDIPKGYYDRMLQKSTTLLDQNVNHWLKSESKNLLVRTFEDGAKGFQARALLSDRYSIIDNHNLLIETLEAIKQTGIIVEIVEARLSETKMYLRVVAPQVEVEAKELLKNYRLAIAKGSFIVSGFTISNSEVGNGSFGICPRAVVLACNNGMTNTEDSFKKIHLGGKMDQIGFQENRDVVRKNLALIQEQIKHAVKTFLSKDYLQKLVDKYTLIGDKPIEAPIDKVIEVVAKEYSITEERKSNILKYFIEGGDTRRIGLASAMTFEAQSLDPDLKEETEQASFDMLKNFQSIEAAAIRASNSN